MELTATEQLERARKSIELAEERVKVIDQRLPELENELEDLILKNEIKGYKGRTIEKTQAEIDNLQKEKATLERTVEVLKKKLPEFERQTRIEVTEQDTVRDYRKAHSGLIELLKGIPSLDGLKAEIQKIQSYREGLEQSQGRYFDLLTVCNDFLIKENLQAVGNVDIETLISDKDSIDYQDLLILSDSLIDINEMINDLQYKLFKVGIAQVPIKEIQPEPVPEYSPCGNYYRICEHGTWTLFEKQYKPGKYGGGEEI